jgi:hypothetical protein
LQEISIDLLNHDEKRDYEIDAKDLAKIVFRRANLNYKQKEDPDMWMGYMLEHQN